MTTAPRCRWFQFSLRTMLLMVAMFGVGIFASWHAVLAGVHGGSQWPTILVAAPAAMFSTWAFGDAPAFLFGTVIGVGIEFAICAYLLAGLKNVWAILIALGFHAACGAYLATCI